MHHALGSSEYPLRVKECQLAVEVVRQFYTDLLEQDKVDKANSTSTDISTDTTNTIDKDSTSITNSTIATKATNTTANTENTTNSDIKRIKKPSSIRSLRDVSLEMLETVHKTKPNSGTGSDGKESVSMSRSASGSTNGSGSISCGGEAVTPSKSKSKLSAIPQSSNSCMPSVAYRRARHVITENIRTLDSVQALSDHDWARLGQNMTESHASLSADYEVSCGEIDLLVDLALSVPGVYGSRITGGGFGGCTVTLVERKSVATFKAHVRSKYKEATGLDCICYEVLPSAGTGVIPQTTTAAIAAGSSSSVSVSGRGRTASASVPGAGGLSKWYIITSQMTWLVPAAVFLLAILIIVVGGNDPPLPPPTK